jgi:serine/threonine protein kinase
MPMSKAKEQNNKRSKGKGAGPTRSFDSSVTGPGSQIGPFRIEQELGRGGAGVVYLAHDTKLDRQVAIKSIPPELADSSKALSRFTREARVLASLNHPHIATIHEEIEDDRGVGYLILEYVPGQTLAERIAKKPLNLQEALTIALQIAEAVAAAHEHDVIHRDLKPGNIKITEEGKVKVLDFGLAKVVGGEATDQQTTITQPGRVIGTPAYMSPEQARGKPTDKRSDIWAFGCVLYEMLAGKIPFKGETISDTLANILQTEPRWEALPENIPINIRSLLRHCLKKDPRRRLQHIGDAAIEISDALDKNTGLWAAQTPGIRRIWPTSQQNVVLLCLACLILGAVGATIVVLSLRKEKSPAVSPIKKVFPEVLPEGTSLFIYRGGSIAISPNGQRLVYVGVDAVGTRRLYLRHTIMDDLQATPIHGTEGASGPFFRPDGQWIGFFAEVGSTRELKKVSIQGGMPEFICDVPPQPCGGSWCLEDDSIILSPIFHESLVKVSVSDGVPEMFTALDPNNREYGHLWPDILPGAKGVLYTVWGGDSFEDYRTMIKWKDRGEPQELLSNSSFARYVPTGHLVFVRQGSLMVVPFNPDRPSAGMIHEDARVLRTGIGQTIYGGAQFAIARKDGTFIYADGRTPLGIAEGELVWVNRGGQNETPIADSRQYYDAWARPRLSPDENWIALRVATETHLSIFKLASGWFPPLTSMKGCQGGPVWDPRGDHIVFYCQTANSPPDIYWQLWDNNDSDTAELLHKTVNSEQGTSFSPDGKYLAMTVHYVSETSLAQTSDIWLFDTQTKKATKWTDTPQYNEWSADFSPDGNWIAYISNETGDNEVWVRQFRGSKREKISNDGGSEVMWGPDRKNLELFYRGTKQFERIEIQTEPELKIGFREALFDDVYMRTRFPGHRNYDISKDGKRFLMIKQVDEQPAPVMHLNVELNWFEELKRRVPTGKD